MNPTKKKRPAAKPPKPSGKPAEALDGIGEAVPAVHDQLHNLDQVLASEQGAPQEELAGVVHADAEGSEAQHDLLDTRHSKAARGILASVRDSMDRNYPRGRAFLKKAQASPEGSAAALEELADMFRTMAAFISLRAVVLRHGATEANPMLLVTARNVRDHLVEAASIVDQAPHLPQSWARAEGMVADAVKASKAVGVLLAQDGMSFVAKEDPKLVDGEGRPIVA